MEKRTGGRAAGSGAGGGPGRTRAGDGRRARLQCGRGMASCHAAVEARGVGGTSIVVYGEVGKQVRRWRTASYLANRQLECQGRQGWGNGYLAHSTTERVVPVRGWRLRLWLQPPTALNVIPAHQRRCPQLFAADKLSRPRPSGAVPPDTGLLA
jgi:hypothetical protein